MSKLWVNETEQLIVTIEQERQALALEHESLTKALTAKDDELAHLKAALQSYKRRQEIATPQPSLFLQETSTKDYSYREIVMLVRDQNNGNIPMKQVTQAIRRKATTPSHAASSAYSTIQRLIRQGKVTKVRPGLYRWVNGTTETLEVASTPEASINGIESLAHA